MINCGACSGSKKALCMEAFERFDTYFEEISDRHDLADNSDVDAFVLAQGVGTIFRVMAGDTSAIEELANDPILGGTPEFQKEAEQAMSSLVSDVRAIGCELEPAQIIMKCMAGAVQKAIIEDASDITDYDSAFPSPLTPRASSFGDGESDEFKASARNLDELLSRIPTIPTRRTAFETPEQEEKRLTGLTKLAEEAAGRAKELIRIVEREATIEMDQVRLKYIQEQGWDPENLDFSQRLEVKMKLKSLGYKV